MPTLTKITTRNQLSFAEVSAGRPLALLVAVALLLCHGFFGALHLLPANRVPAPEAAATQEATLEEPRSAHEDSAAQSVGEEYFAVLVVLLLGFLFGSVLRRIGRWCERAAPRTYSGLRTRLRVAHPARGPTGALLQVFRL